MSGSTAVSIGFAVFGLRLGLRPLSDNSFLTHVATGRLILESGRVPTSDPYSFTAHDAPWVVQSWLASVLYGAVDRTAGGAGLLALNAVLLTGLGLLVAALTARADGLLVRIAIGGLALAVGSAAWSERPLLFGLLLLGSTALIADRELDAKWLLPTFALWVNLHGSFPLGLVLLATLATGAALDRASLVHLRQCATWAILGTLVGALHPQGLRLLSFPFVLLARSDRLQGVIEWQSPTFQSGAERAWLLQLALVLLLLTRRPSYRFALPAVVFGVASLLAVRNIAPASLVLLPALASSALGIGSISGRAATRTAAGAVAGLVVLAVAFVATAGARPAFDLRAYPVEILALGQWALGADARIAAEDTVGNYRTVVLGDDARVFYDDRFDMYPAALATDQRTLFAAQAGWEQVFERHKIDGVVWRRDRPLSGLLLLDASWQVVAENERWALYARRPRSER